MARSNALLWIALAAIVACASPTPPAPGAFTAWGYVKVVPREGLPSSGGAYGDRRVRDAELVDYSKPGFVVVFTDGSAPDAGELALRIVAGKVRARIEPAQAALGAAGRIAVQNEDARPHLLSCPEAGLLRELAPGERIAFAPTEAGPLSLYLLDGSGSEALLFAAPGPFAVVSSSGRYELRDLAPGHHVLHAWHPRFPPVRHELDADAGEIRRVDLEMGVQRGEIGSEASRAD